MSDTDSGLQTLFELVKQLGTFALDSVHTLSRIVDPVHWTKTADKTTKTFYGTVKFADSGQFSRWARAYVANPNIVSLEDRQRMAAELDALFDQVNSEADLALESLEATLSKAPQKKQPST